MLTAAGYVILTVSDATYIIDTENYAVGGVRPWRMSAQDTSAGGVVSARINVPLLGKPLRFDFMRRTDYLLDMEDTGKCCVVGLARLLNDSEDLVSADLDLAFQREYAPDDAPFLGRPWQEVGCTGKMMLAFAEHRGIGMIVMSGSRVTHKMDPGDGKRSVTYSNWNKHARFMESSQPFSRLHVSNEAHSQRVQVRRVDKTPVFSEWLPWDGDVRPGHFWATRDEIEYTRTSWMEKDAVVPRTKISGVFIIKSISRRCGKDWCVITSAPTYAPLID